MKSNAWDVYIPVDPLNYRHIDTVFFDEDCTRDYVRRSLIDHDSYDAGIIIAKNGETITEALEREKDNA